MRGCYERRGVAFRVARRGPLTVSPRSAILRGRSADAVVRTVDVPVAREGGATPPRGPTAIERLAAPAGRAESLPPRSFVPNV